MYETILVAYDGSEYSKAGLLEASFWIKKHGGKLFAIYVVYFNEEEFLLYPEIREKRLKKAVEECQQSKEEIKKIVGVDFQCIIKEGDPCEEILEEANTIGATLIVAGTYGKKGFLKRLVLGSVSTEIALKSPIDVLVVKKPCEICQGEYKHILVPFDNSEFSRLALKRAFRFYKEYNSNITVVYIIPKYQELVEFYITPTIKDKMIREGKKILKEAEELAMKENISIETVLEEGKVGEKIIEISKIKKCDLIVIGPFGLKSALDRKLIGSTTEKILHLSEIPVLIVKED